MAASPQFKVYDSRNTYQAACKEIEAAAALVAFYGLGSTIRLNHKAVIYREGQDGDAAQSYDDVAITVQANIERYWHRPACDKVG